jgi:hypothetical protein
VKGGREWPAAGGGRRAYACEAFGAGRRCVSRHEIVKLIQKILKRIFWTKEQVGLWLHVADELLQRMREDEQRFLSRNSVTVHHPLDLCISVTDTIHQDACRKSFFERFVHCSMAHSIEHKGPLPRNFRRMRDDPLQKSIITKPADQSLAKILQRFRCERQV